MALHNFHNNHRVAFPTPWRGRNVYHSNVYTGGHPHGLFNPRNRYYSHPDTFKDVTDFRDLYNKSLNDQSGDLGWSLDYATAWGYRYLVGNRPEIADCIDAIRELGEEVMRDTPYLIFNYIDRAMFGSKLKNMVYLRWKSLPGHVCGRTSAPGIIGTRITVEINCVPFLEADDDEEATIDELLEALIHQMIHAFFHVCCGAQKKGEKADGRMSDGLHFGVLLRTIADISHYCDGGPLTLIFHAHKRRQLPLSEEGMAGLMRRSCRPSGSFIALDPSGNCIGPAAADGQTHCMHDNRRITKSMIQNWQVESYSKFLELDMESKGTAIFDFDGAGKDFKEYDRLKGPPSVSYAELVWDGKHVMVNREKALAFASIEWPLKKHGRYELEIPKCDVMTFRCVYDFVQKGEYVGNEPVVSDGMREHILQPVNPRMGPPVLHTRRLDGQIRAERVELEPATDVLKHLRVFKVAEKLKFEELLAYSLRKLWSVTNSQDHPMSCLEELYEYHKDKTSGPIHPELHKWSRAFLERREDYAPLGLANLQQQQLLGMMMSFPNIGLGATPATTNLRKLVQWYPDRFKHLWMKSQSFRDDIELVQRQKPEPWGRRLLSDGTSLRRSLSSEILRRGLGGGGVGGIGGQEPLRLTGVQDQVRERWREDLDVRAAGWNRGLGVGEVS